MIFNFRLFWRLTVRSFFRSAGTNGPLNRNRFIVLLLFYPVWGSLTLLGWLGFALDDVFFSAYRKQVVEKPLFIVSNFRSGSTFVHRTLVRDEATFTGMRTGDIYLMPSITQRRIFSLLARVDAVFGHICEKSLRRLDAHSLGQLRIHPFSLFDAEEDEHLLFYAWSTFFANFVFPYLDEMPPYQYFDTETPPAERKRIMAFHQSCIKRHLFATGGRHYIAKNPLFSAKIESLLETFPTRASFIWSGIPWRCFRPRSRYSATFGADSASLRRSIPTATRSWPGQNTGTIIRSRPSIGRRRTAA
jgi:omega-hydroxy-beta-dihydromenaquinone-9 sulfotransferase